MNWSGGISKSPDSIFESRGSINNRLFYLWVFVKASGLKHHEDMDIGPTISIINGKRSPPLEKGGEPACR